MEDVIEIRDTVEGDIPYLSEIIDETWDFSCYSKENGVQMSALYLLHCSHGNVRSLTLTVNGRPEGIVIFESEEPGRTLEGYDSLYASLEGTEGFDKMIVDLEGLLGIYRRFESRFKGDDLSELRLLIVSKGQKGKGLGKMLLRHARDEAEREGKKGLFFYSDSDCNTGFYDSIGAERLGSEEMVCAGERLIVYAYRLC